MVNGYSSSYWYDRNGWCHDSLGNVSKSDGNTGNWFQQQADGRWYYGNEKNGWKVYNSDTQVWENYEQSKGTSQNSNSLSQNSQKNTELLFGDNPTQQTSSATKPSSSQDEALPQAPTQNGKGQWVDSSGRPVKTDSKSPSLTDDFKNLTGENSSVSSAMLNTLKNTMAAPEAQKIASAMGGEGGRALFNLGKAVLNNTTDGLGQIGTPAENAGLTAACAGIDFASNYLPQKATDGLMNGLVDAVDRKLNGKPMLDGGQLSSLAKNIGQIGDAYNFFTGQGKASKSADTGSAKSDSPLSQSDASGKSASNSSSQSKGILGSLVDFAQKFNPLSNLGFSGSNKGKESTSSQKGADSELMRSRQSSDDTRRQEQRQEACQVAQNNQNQQRQRYDE